jgi:ABC-type uncharacterized transport system substrate-binding protein
MERRAFIVMTLSVAGWPFGGRAQQKAMPVIGILYGFGSSTPANPAQIAFGQGLNDTGYVEGQNLAIERRYAEGQPDRFPALAADLVGRNVDVLVATGIDSVLAAKNATSTIPIVFAVGIDPVELGLVASLGRPGGNRGCGCAIGRRGSSVSGRDELR